MKISSKHRFVLLACVALTFAHCKKNADPAEAPVATPEAKAPEVTAEKKVETTLAQITKPFLWSVSKEDTLTGYVLGTVHMGVDADKQFPPSVWTALEASTSVCTEADISDPSLVSAMMRTDGTTLSAEIGPVAWKQFQEVVSPAMASGFDRMKPVAAATMLMVRGVPMTVPMESAISARAKKRNMPHLYLEEGMFQMQLLDKLMDAKALVQMLEHMEENKRYTEKMLSLYVAGDADPLETLLFTRPQWDDSSPEEFAKNLDAMLYNRNADWIPKLETMFADGTPFCAFGAAHLFGDKGVLALLKKQGYQLQRI